MRFYKKVIAEEGLPNNIVNLGKEVGDIAFFLVIYLLDTSENQGFSDASRGKKETSNMKLINDIECSAEYAQIPQKR